MDNRASSCRTIIGIAEKDTLGAVCGFGGAATDRLGADGLGSAGYVAREVIGAETMVDYTRKQDLLERFSKQFGTALGRGISETLGSGAVLR